MENEHLKDEIDFKDLIKDPVRLFGWIYPVILVLVVGVGIFYIKSMNNISFNEIKPVVEKTTIPKIEMRKGEVLPAVDLKNVRNAPFDLIQKGKELFEKTCASCHGTKGLGDGPAGVALNPSPRNFTSKEGWTNSRDIVGMYKTLQEGIIKNGMAAYEYIIPEERLSIIHYIRTLGEFPEITDAQVEELDLTYGFSKEVTTPNQIPVDMAMNKIESEKEPELERLNSFLANDILDGAEEISEYTNNLSKVLSVFLDNPEIRNYNNFKLVVIRNPLTIGFNVKIDRISDQRLRNIHDKIIKIIEQ